MKRLSLSIVLLVAFVLLAAGCKGPQQSAANSAKAGTDFKSVAVVSFAVNNYGHFGSGGVINPVLIDSTLTQLVGTTEKILAEKLVVKPAKSFVNTKAYRDLSIGQVKSGLYAPKFAGVEMPSFSAERRDIVKGVLPAETAKELCRVIGVDAVVLVYSEWMIDSGKFVPTIKALTKNCFAMYTKDGRKLYYDRKDMRGSRVIGGAFAGVHINEDTIDQWIEAYGKSAELVLRRHM